MITKRYTKHHIYHNEFNCECKSRQIHFYEIYYDNNLPVDNLSYDYEDTYKKCVVYNKLNYEYGHIEKIYDNNIILVRYNNSIHNGIYNRHQLLNNLHICTTQFNNLLSNHSIITENTKQLNTNSKLGMRITIREDINYTDVTISAIININNELIIPTYISHIEFLTNVNIEFLTKLPPTITHLSFRYDFNNKIIKNYIPNTITHLTFGDDFNQMITYIPPSVTQLILGENYNNIILKSAISKNITHFIIESDIKLYNNPQPIKLNNIKIYFYNSTLQKYKILQLFYKFINIYIFIKKILRPSKYVNSIYVTLSSVKI